MDHKASAKKVQKDGGRKKNSRGGAGVLRRSTLPHVSKISRGSVHRI